MEQRGESGLAGLTQHPEFEGRNKKGSKVGKVEKIRGEGCPMEMDRMREEKGSRWGGKRARLKDGGLGWAMSGAGEGKEGWGVDDGGKGKKGKGNKAWERSGGEKHEIREENNFYPFNQRHTHESDERRV